MAPTHDRAPPVRARRARQCVAALLAVSLATSPLAQMTPTTSTAPSAAAAPSPSGGIWTQVPAPDEPRPALTPSETALRGPDINGLRGSPLPELGDASQVGFSPAQERKVGDAIIRQIRAQGAYMDDPEVNDYLNELGHRLVAAVPDTKQDFEFFAVPDNQINAFALPGGYVGVNTGLILLTQNESELAAVLGHEISHVTQHHMARMLDNQKTSMLTTLAGLVVAILAARAGGSNGAQATQAAIASSQALAIQNQLNFTRENEYEADRIGFQRMVAAGYDPNGMAQMMERLQRSTRFIDGNAPSYLRTHPITYERIAEAQARAQGLPYRQIPDSLEFHLVRALLKSYQGDARDRVQDFEDALRLKKYNNEIAERYGLVASLLRAQDYPRAKTELAKLEKIAPPNPMVEAMAGNVLMASGDYAAASKRFEAALARYPNKLQLVYDYPESLLKAHRAAEASAFVEQQLLRFPNNGQLHQIAARAYAEQNMHLKEHQHQGEYYAWMGNLPLAIGQFELAAKSGDGDFYQVSVVETRLRALRAEQADLKKDAFGPAG
ncbi:MAG TPA: M48 family metalloprotease [Casimicrobiaceae bacterium]|nr:M48 family metalloprotease [Casimicrobiaceae bacterium]